MKVMKKAIATGLAFTLAAGTLVGCGGGDSSADTKYELTVSGIGGSLNWLHGYIAEEKGWFEDEGLAIQDAFFPNEPVLPVAPIAEPFPLPATLRPIPASFHSSCLLRDSFLPERQQVPQAFQLTLPKQQPM